MYHRRRRANSTPSEPSASALFAASTVYSPAPPTLAAAAAAAASAALRNAAPSPTPIGSIPTKRMLKRRDSYSSASDSRPGGVQRTSSTGSLTERRFRKERGPATGTGSSSTSSRRASVDTGSRRASAEIGRRASTGGGSSCSSRAGNGSSSSTPRPLARKVTAYHEEGEDSSEDYPADDDSDLQLPLPPRSPALRAFPTTLRGSRSSASSSGSKRVKKQFTRPRDAPTSSSDRDRERRRYSLDYADSSASLDSIAEDAALPPPAPPAPLPSKIPEEAESAYSSSDDDTRSKRTLLSLPRHHPPARSASPSKSALKHAPSLSKPRVSFSDEDSIASFSPYTRAPLLLDDSPRRLPIFGIGGITAPSPPPSDSSQESIIGLESALRYPKGQPPLGAGSAVKRLLGEGPRPPPPLGGKRVPEEVRRLRVGPLTPPGTRAGLAVPEVRVVAATPAEERDMASMPAMYGSGSDSDSDSGESIYSDAYEDLSPPSLAALPGILEIAPPPPPPPPPPPTTAPEDPPLPPDFLNPRPRPPPQPQPQPTKQLTRSPSASSSASSTASRSSFRRLSPRSRPGSRMKASLRGGGNGHVRTHSRFSTDSDLPVVLGVGAGAGTVKERAGSEGTVKRRKRGFWAFLKGGARGAKLRRRSTGAGLGGGEKEVGMEVGVVGVGVGTEKRRRLWRVRRVLGLK